MENNTTAVNTIFGAVSIFYYLTFADDNTDVMCETFFTDIAVARDCAWEFSLSSDRPINIFQVHGLSDNLTETVRA